MTVPSLLVAFARRPLSWLAAVPAVAMLLLLTLVPPRKSFRASHGAGGSVPYRPQHHGDSSSSSPYFGDEEDAGLVADAHRLPSADSFLLHFQAVLQQPGITAAGAHRTCKWPANATVNFQFPADADWVARERPADELAARRGEWHDFVRRGMVPWSQVASRFEGRGVVVVADNRDAFQRTRVLLRALRRLQSPVAVEIHHWRDELDDAARAALEDEWPGPGGDGAGRLFFNDLSGAHNPVAVAKDDGLLVDSQLKPAAVLNSRFAEVLLLDSDNVPLLDPDALWDSRAYADFGTVFWPDVARTRPQNPMWVISNTPCAMDEHGQESGQLMVDKRRFWYHLQLAAWWNSAHADYYSAFVLGDKDLFRFAWHALRTRHGAPRKWLASVGTLNDGFYCGHSFAQHHPDDGRVAFLHAGLVKTVAPEVMRWNRDVRGGYFRHYKRADSETDPTVPVNVAIKSDPADYVPDHSPDFHPAMCADMFDVEARDINELVPFMEATFREIGGYWQLDGDPVPDTPPAAPPLNETVR